jgi:hypothetical protein
MSDVPLKNIYATNPASITNQLSPNLRKFVSGTFASGTKKKFQIIFCPSLLPHVAQRTLEIALDELQEVGTQCGDAVGRGGDRRARSPGGRGAGRRPGGARAPRAEGAVGKQAGGGARVPRRAGGRSVAGRSSQIQRRTMRAPVERGRGARTGKARLFS